MNALSAHRVLAFSRGERHFCILPAGGGMRGYLGLRDGVVVATAPARSLVARALLGSPTAAGEAHLDFS
jgi:hypothetical protein